MLKMVALVVALEVDIIAETAALERKLHNKLMQLVFMEMMAQVQNLVVLTALLVAVVLEEMEIAIILLVVLEELESHTQ
jgi:hypothetical protein